MSTDDNGEYNIEGALADELQLVQASQQKLYQQVEEKENEIRKLKLEQLASDLELKTLTEVSRTLISSRIFCSLKIYATFVIFSCIYVRKYVINSLF